uniref:Uncharacterized protein n=1 Tax=Siphoviridae sp. ctTC45 TaxID=2827573 RepID=A0A8S5LQ74_9CAUD|nr:MAG TPA: hypothetical protein [Siphoviridae sp. ctTC45]DAV23226.1 MAG TPA: hypothetical protein [Caudoviricetes sp.]
MFFFVDISSIRTLPHLMPYEDISLFFVSINSYIF